MQSGLTRRSLAVAGIAAIAGASVAQSSPEPAAPLIYYGGAAARLTMDRDDQGGNPLASALIDVLRKQPLTLAEFGPELAGATARHAGGWQMVEAPKKLPDPKWTLAADAKQTRVALVLINSRYTAPGVESLPGARFDAQRLPAALEAAGFRTRLLLDADDAAVRQALKDFADSSASADASLIFLGGHGVQHRRIVYWMLRDYPERDAKFLATHALPVSEIGKAARARSANLILYGGCRDDPFPPIGESL
ncbi:MAG: caspase family protein [Alphaproteobacteria bacterium]